VCVDGVGKGMGICRRSSLCVRVYIWMDGCIAFVAHAWMFEYPCIHQAWCKPPSSPCRPRWGTAWAPTVSQPAHLPSESLNERTHAPACATHLSSSPLNSQYTHACTYTYIHNRPGPAHDDAQRLRPRRRRRQHRCTCVRVQCMDGALVQQRRQRKIEEGPLIGVTLA